MSNSNDGEKLCYNKDQHESHDWSTRGSGPEHYLYNFTCPGVIMSDPTIPAQLCDDRTTHEPHQWLDSPTGNPANHTWWCPGLSYAHLEEDDEMSVANAQFLKEYKAKVVDRVQAMQEALTTANNEYVRLGRQIHKLDDSLIALRMELEE